MGAQSSTQRRVTENLGFRRRSRGDINIGSASYPGTGSAQLSTSEDGEDGGRRSSSRGRRAVASLVSIVTKKTRSREAQSGRETPATGVGQTTRESSASDESGPEEGSERAGGGDHYGGAPTGDAEVSEIKRRDGRDGLFPHRPTDPAHRVSRHARPRHSPVSGPPSSSSTSP